MPTPSLWIQNLWPLFSQDLRSWPMAERDLGDKLFQSALAIAEHSFLEQQQSPYYLNGLVISILLHSELLHQHQFLVEVQQYQLGLRVCQCTFQQKGEWPELNELHMHVRCQLVPYILKREELIKSHLVAFYEKQHLQTNIPFKQEETEGHERHGRL